MTEDEVLAIVARIKAQEAKARDAVFEWLPGATTAEACYVWNRQRDGWANSDILAQLEVWRKADAARIEEYQRIHGPSLVTAILGKED